jgi:hypothetical protein
MGRDNFFFGFEAGGSSAGASVEFQGYLFKKNRKWADWKRGFFSVREGQLHYYSKDKSSKPDDSIDLLLCTVKPIPEAEGGRQFCFEIISPYKTFTLQAEDGDTMQKWTSVITNALSSKLSAQSAEQIANTPKPQLKHGASISSASARKQPNAESLVTSPGAPTTGKELTAAEVSEADKKERLRILQQLHTLDSQNAVCADCGAESASTKSPQIFPLFITTTFPFKIECIISGFTSLLIRFDFGLGLTLGGLFYGLQIPLGLQLTLEF